MDPLLEWENKLTLDVVQAALGLISPEIGMISFAWSIDRMHLYVAVRAQSDEVVEDVDDLISEIEALQGGPMKIIPHIITGMPDDTWPGFKARRVYVAKPSS